MLITHTETSEWSKIMTHTVHIYLITHGSVLNFIDLLTKVFDVALRDAQHTKTYA